MRRAYHKQGEGCRGGTSLPHWFLGEKPLSAPFLSFLCRCRGLGGEPSASLTRGDSEVISVL